MISSTTCCFSCGTALPEGEGRYSTPDGGGGGMSELLDACKAGDVEAVRQLLSAGADVNAKYEDGHTPLHAACANDHPDTVRLLLEKGADMNVENRFGHTPLHLACIYDHADVVQFLLEKGAKVNVRDMFGDTPLHIAMGCPPGDTREEILDLFREHAPELVMEVWCTQEAQH